MPSSLHHSLVRAVRGLDHAGFVAFGPVGRTVTHDEDDIVAQEHVLELLEGIEAQGVVDLDRRVRHVRRHLAHMGGDLFDGV